MEISDSALKGQGRSTLMTIQALGPLASSSFPEVQHLCQ
jgi:hypothetical protein